MSRSTIDIDGDGTVWVDGERADETTAAAIRTSFQWEPRSAIWAVEEPSAVRSAVEVEATTGFEPVNRGFADLSRPSDPPSLPVADDDPSSLTEAHRT